MTHASHNTNELSVLSQVKESATHRTLTKGGQAFVLIASISAFFLAYKLMPSHTSHKTPESARLDTSNPYTLKENLGEIERLQNAAREHGMARREEAVEPQNGDNAMSREQALRMNAPTTFINVDDTVANMGRHNADLAANANPLMAGVDANSAFLNAKTGIESVNAQALPHPEYTLSAGELIPATLETAINSELPGMVRAITSRDVYALIGTRILIPKGSRLIGQYSSGNIGDAQSRVLISWTRAQLPNGVVVGLNSPSTDALGRSGQGADTVDRHFAERFSLGVLFSVIGAGASTVGVNPADPYNSVAGYRLAMANSLQQSAMESLQNDRRIQATLHIDQGAQINVFVARDLNFFHVTRG